jgi:hypothetical protein
MHLGMHQVRPLIMLEEAHMNLQWHMQVHSMLPNLLPSLTGGIQLKRGMKPVIGI